MANGYQPRKVFLPNESQCHKKRSYFSEISANVVKAKAESERGVLLRVYKCPCCLQWHLTKRNP